jgi:hypothetical protein
MLRSDLSSRDLTIELGEDTLKQNGSYPIEVSKLFDWRQFGYLPDILLTLDEPINRIFYPSITAGMKNLCPPQR